MTKTFLTKSESELIEKTHAQIKEYIVTWIKNKYCLELCNIDSLVQNIMKIMVNDKVPYTQTKHGNMLRMAETWFKTVGIKTGEFHNHSVFGLAKMIDYNYHCIFIKKHTPMTKFKYWLLTKLFL